MSYNNSVLVGNWSEERLKNEYEFKLFLRKRDRRELLLQKSRTLFSNLLKERPLAISGSFVQFGYNVQLVASDMPAKPAVPGTKQAYGLALSSLVRERQVDYTQNICDGCMMTLSPITTPCCRNTFVMVRYSQKKPQILAKVNRFLPRIIREATEIKKLPNFNRVDGWNVPIIWDPIISLTKPKKKRNTARLQDIVSSFCANIGTEKLNSVHGEDCRDKVNYGDEFLLRAENYGDPEAPPLYVRYTPASTPEPRDRMPLRLSAVLDSNCRFTTMNLLPRDRIEGFGSPVKTNDRLIIKNCIADQSLCGMNQHWIQTFFGAECGVTCRNYIDIHGRYTAENIFTMVSDVETKSKK